MENEKEKNDKFLLKLEIVVCYLSILILFSFILGAMLFISNELIQILLIVFGLLNSLIGIFYALKLEQIAGYYECKKCNFKYVPSYKSMLFAMHIGRTRYMKCPKCNMKSWQKKVISNK